MTIEEVFNQLATHIIEGIKFHQTVMNVYLFLGLYGYAMLLEYQFLTESHEYSQLVYYYTTHYYKLIEVKDTPAPELHPSTWYKYKTQDVDNSTRKSAIKELMLKWINWEQDTKILYQTMRQELYNLSEVAAALELDRYILDVTEELHMAEQLLINLEAINYNLDVIMPEQNKLYKKYKKKLW